MPGGEPLLSVSSSIGRQQVAPENYPGARRSIGREGRGRDLTPGAYLLDDAPDSTAKGRRSMASFTIFRTWSRSRSILRLSPTTLTLDSGEFDQCTGTSITTKFIASAKSRTSTSKEKPSICCRSKISRAACALNPLNPHWVSKNLKPDKARTIRLQGLLISSRMGL